MRGILACIVLLLAFTGVDSEPPCKRRVCYITNWAQHRKLPGVKRFQPTDVDPKYCTHLMYAFATIRDQQIKELERNDKDSRRRNDGGYLKAVDLKKKNPQLKVLLSLGAWNSGTSSFSELLKDYKARSKLAKSIITFLTKYKFDGLDIFWAYPGAKGGVKDDKWRFTVVLSELLKSFKANRLAGGQRLMLTAAVAAAKHHIDRGYEVKKIGKYLDFVTLMAYDMHNSGWESFLAHHSPLYTGNFARGDSAYLSVDWAVTYWINKGIDKSKLILGLPTYGRSFTIIKGNDTLGANATVGATGKYTLTPGFMSYYEICELKRRQGGKRHLLDQQRAPYLTQGKTWIGYDDEQSVLEKVKYVRDKQLGGVMMWTLDLDDYAGKFCGSGKFPLARAMYEGCEK